MPQLKLKDYSSAICLHDQFVPRKMPPTQLDHVVDVLIKDLLEEPDVSREIEIPDDYMGKRNLLRALLNIRSPKQLNDQFLKKMDYLLQTELMEKGIVNVEDLESVSTLFPNNPYFQSDKFILWQGDITQLKTDVIVNAANNQMLGCFQPLHACIDNAIHSAAGPQLRNDCKIIMSKQRELEETGNAKITRAYNLPSKFVLHTVGPIVPKGKPLSQKQRNKLASCYISCLELANQMKEIKSIAFCAISTGVFGFPKYEAAEIAIKTVNQWLIKNKSRLNKIVFNVFGQGDYEIYSNLFKGEK
ncbi:MULTISPECIES: protein-ADP-ribose hydrolase [Bacillus]|uniref:protein-ADP-ribose hydrolase n=1 Tax=Bacillus TaxID=1386 RepID=UPI0020C0F52E|nr:MULTISPECIES: protein-ADP-ribose hydrolase [Bacillus]